MPVSTKLRRQRAIIEAISSSPVSTQSELQRRLKIHGFRVAQTTISRDLKEIGVVRRAANGVYQLAGGEPANPQAAADALARAVDQFLLGVERVQQLVVIATGRAQAGPLAEAIDRCTLPEVVGTIAGNNTVLAVCRDHDAAAALVKLLESLVPQRGQNRTGTG